METTPEEIKKHVKSYIAVGIALGIFTIVTVAVGIFDLGEPGISGPDLFVGLLIATIKSSLVALIFMHLNHERGLIYKMLAFTFCFALGLMILTLFAHLDPIREAFPMFTRES